MFFIIADAVYDFFENFHLPKAVKRIHLKYKDSLAVTCHHIITRVDSAELAV